MKIKERKHEIPFLYAISIGATVNFFNSTAYNSKFSIMGTCLEQSKAHLLRNIKESLSKICFSQKSLVPSTSLLGTEHLSAYLCEKDLFIYGPGAHLGADNY